MTSEQQRETTEINSNKWYGMVDGGSDVVKVGLVWTARRGTGIVVM